MIEVALKLVGMVNKVGIAIKFFMRASRVDYSAPSFMKILDMPPGQQ